MQIVWADFCRFYLNRFVHFPADFSRFHLSRFHFQLSPKLLQKFGRDFAKFSAKLLQKLCAKILANFRGNFGKSSANFWRCQIFGKISPKFRRNFASSKSALWRKHSRWPIRRPGEGPTTAKDGDWPSECVPAAAGAPESLVSKMEKVLKRFSPAPPCR